MKRILSGLCGLTLLLSGCGLVSQSSDDGVFTIATYGGSYGDSIRERIIKPFEEKYDVKIREEMAVSNVTLGKLMQGGSDIDVAFMDGGVSEHAESMSVLEPIDTSKLSNADSLIDEAIYEKDGKNFAISAGYYAVGLTYNSEKIDTPPKSWKDLWKPEYADKVTAPSVSNAMGLPFVLGINQAYGGEPDSIDTAVKELGKLKVASYFDTAGAGENLFQGDEATIGAAYASSAAALKKGGKPIEYVTPEEGAIAGDIRLHIPKTSSNTDLAYKFIDLAISAQAQQEMSADLLNAPVNKKAKLSESLKAQMPYGKDGSIADLNVPDWFALNENRQKWTIEFNQEVIG